MHLKIEHNQYGVIMDETFINDQIIISNGLGG